MTLFPTGDRGQRYEISCTGYPQEGRTVMGWTESIEGAMRMTNSFKKAPGATSVTIRDRWQATPEWPNHEYTMYAGTLR